MTASRTWHDLQVHPCFDWTEPDAGVVAAVPHWRAEGRRLVYDLGCGAGRHMAYLEAHGFQVCGTDVSPKALRTCAERLAQVGLPAWLVRADMAAAPFHDKQFDVAVSTNVLNHGLRGLLQQTLDEVRRVLRPGGECYLTVLNTWDWRCGDGQEVEAGSFVLAAGPEAGVLHHFFAEDDLRDWVRAFELLELSREQTPISPAGGAAGPAHESPVMRDAWAVLLRK